MNNLLDNKIMEAAIAYRNANYTYGPCPCCSGTGRIAVLMERLTASTSMEMTTPKIEYQRCKYCRGYANAWVRK